MDAVSASASLSKLITDTLTNLSNNAIMVGANLLAVIVQQWTEAVGYLGVPIALLYLLSLFVIIGILVGVVVHGAKGIWKFLSKVPHWAFYTFPSSIFLAVSIGIELAVIFCISIALFLILTCPKWIFELPTRTRGKFTLLCNRIQVVSPAWLHTMCRHWVVKALVYILVVLPRNFLEWLSNSVSTASAVWNRQGHNGVLQFFVLIPGLAFALAINMIAYILLFLPITGLAAIWDRFFLEHPKLTSDNMMATDDPRRISICLSDDISELNLDLEEDDNGTYYENIQVVENGAAMQYANLWRATDLEHAATFFSEMDRDFYNGRGPEDMTGLECGSDLEKEAILDGGTSLEKAIAIEARTDFDKGAIVEAQTTSTQPPPRMGSS